MKIGTVDVVHTAKETFKQFQKDDLQGNSAQVAYNILFAVVPLLIFLTALSGFVARAAGIDDSMNRVTNWLFDHMGTNSANAVRDPISAVVKQNNSGLLSFGALLALWGGKNAVSAVMKSLNAAYEVKEGRSFIKRNAIAIGLTIALGISVTLASAVFLAGASFAGELVAKIGFGDTWLVIWSYLRWPVIAVILIFAISFLYWAAPNRQAPFTLLTPGSVLTVIGWGIATAGISLYFANFAGYAGGAYGALGGVLAFIFWLNLMVLILLIGAELNDVILDMKGVPVVEKDPPKGDQPAPRAVPSHEATPGSTPAFAASDAHPAFTQSVSGVPRGTSAPPRKTSSSPKAPSTKGLVLMMATGRALLKARRLLKRFLSGGQTNPR